MALTEGFQTSFPQKAAGCQNFLQQGWDSALTLDEVPFFYWKLGGILPDIGQLNMRLNYGLQCISKFKNLFI